MLDIRRDKYPSVSFHSTAPLCFGKSEKKGAKRLPCVRVRVSGGHLCEAEALTEAAAETVGRLVRHGGVVTY